MYIKSIRGPKAKKSVDINTKENLCNIYKNRIYRIAANMIEYVIAIMETKSFVKRLDGTEINAIVRITGIKNHMATSVFIYKSEKIAIL